MKRSFVAMLTAAVALTTVGSTAALAHDEDYGHDDGFRHARHERGPESRHDDPFRAGEYHRPRSQEVRRWAPGLRLPPSYRAARYVIVQPSRYQLRPAPRGHQWVRVDSDVLLVASRTGLIIDVRPGFFR